MKKQNTIERPFLKARWRVIECSGCGRTVRVEDTGTRSDSYILCQNCERRFN